MSQHFLVEKKAIKVYCYLTENLGFDELESQTDEQSEEEENIKLIINKDEKFFWQLSDSEVVDFIKKGDFELTPITLKEIKQWGN